MQSFLAIDFLFFHFSIKTEEYLTVYVSFERLSKHEITKYQSSKKENYSENIVPVVWLWDI